MEWGLQELQNLKRLELLLWESDKIKPVTSHELVCKLVSYLLVYEEALSY